MRFLWRAQLVEYSSSAANEYLPLGGVEEEKPLPVPGIAGFYSLLVGLGCSMPKHYRTSILNDKEASSSVHVQTAPSYIGDSYVCACKMPLI